MLFAYLVIASVSCNTVAALERVFSRTPQRELLLDAQYWRQRLLSIQAFSPGWVLARIRGVLAILPFCGDSLASESDDSNDVPDGNSTSSGKANPIGSEDGRELANRRQAKTKVGKVRKPRGRARAKKKTRHPYERGQKRSEATVHDNLRVIINNARTTTDAREQFITRRLPSSLLVGRARAECPVHFMEGACCSHGNLRHVSGGLHGDAVLAADQLLQGDRLVGGPRGLPLLTILDHFRERVQKAPCRPLLETQDAWVAAILQ